VQALLNVQLIHQTFDCGGFADIDQFISVPEFLLGLFLCGSVSFSSRFLYSKIILVTGKKGGDLLGINFVMTLLSQLRNAKGRKILLPPSQLSHVGDNLLLERPNGGKFVNQRSMPFLERSRIFGGEKRCCRIARMFESGMNFIGSGQHGTLGPPGIRITHLSGMLPLAWGFNLNNGRGLCSLPNQSIWE